MPMSTPNSTPPRRPSPDDVRKVLKNKGVPKAFLDAKLTDLDDDLQMRLVPSWDTSVYATGLPGRGKSYAAAAWLRAAVEREAYWGSTVTGRAGPIPILGTPGWQVNAGWVRQVPWLNTMRDGVWTQFARAACIYWLVFDDLGAGSWTEWARERVESLIQERADACLPTFVTSNLTLNDIVKVANLPRLASRLAAFLPVHFGGPDRRPRQESDNVR